jgi:hypothetical protein
VAADAYVQSRIDVAENTQKGLGQMLEHVKRTFGTTPSARSPAR